MQLSLKGQRPLAILANWHTLPKQTQLDITGEFFTPETIEEVGCLVLGAVLAGDKQMIGFVKGAIKAGDHLFNRDRELTLLRLALRYTLIHWPCLMLTHKGDVHRAVNELKKGFEQERRKKLEPHQWQRLRLALGLPKRISVRARQEAREAW